MMVDDGKYIREDCIGVYVIANGYLIITRMRMLLVEVHQHHSIYIDLLAEIVFDDCLSLRTVYQKDDGEWAAVEQEYREKEDIGCDLDFSVREGLKDKKNEQANCPEDQRSLNEHEKTSQEMKEIERMQKTERDLHRYFIEFVTLLPFDFFDHHSNKAGQLFGCRFQTQRIFIGQGNPGKQVCLKLEEIIRNEVDNHNYGKNEGVN